MAATNGFKTSIRTGSTYIVLMDGWDLNITMNNPEYASFGTTFYNCMSAMKKWTASCKGTLDRAATGQSAIIDQLESSGTAADIALRFYPSTATGTYWSGNARVENVVINSAVDDKVGVSLAFKGNGAITYTST